jgi:hypothetical protein
MSTLNSKSGAKFQVSNFQWLMMRTIGVMLVLGIIFGSEIWNFFTKSRRVILPAPANVSSVNYEEPVFSGSDFLQKLGVNTRSIVTENLKAESLIKTHSCIFTYDDGSTLYIDITTNETPGSVKAYRSARVQKSPCNKVVTK